MMKIKRFSLGFTVLFVLLATCFGVNSLHNARAATVCTPTSTVGSSYTKDGAGDVCFQTASLCTYINSWNLTTLEVNGTAYTNQYIASSSIAPLNGTYTIHYVSTAAWGHFESGGTCSVSPSPTRTSTRASASTTATRTRTPTATSIVLTATPTLTPTSIPNAVCSPVNAIIASPFEFQGAGTYCWQTNSIANYLNSVTATKVTVNGVNYTNLLVVPASLPAKINGYWYVSFYSVPVWGFFEIK